VVGKSEAAEARAREGLASSVQADGLHPLYAAASTLDVDKREREILEFRAWARKETRGKIADDVVSVSDGKGGTREYPVNEVLERMDALEARFREVSGAMPTVPADLMPRELADVTQSAPELSGDREPHRSGGH
jgi:hypothetical protein